MMKRLWQFDYLKAICILFVIITHISRAADQSNLFVFAYVIDMAVPLFMIISGYMNAKSCSHNEMPIFKTWFKPGKMWERLKRIYIPFLIILLLEIFLIVFIQQEKMGLKDCIYAFLTGGRGPGSYYIPILVQLVFCFPFIYFIISKRPVVGSILLIVIQLALEIAMGLLQMPMEFYRLLIFRYFVFIAFGILLYKYYSRIRMWMIVLLGIGGGAYIWLVSFTAYEPHIFKNWTSTSMPTVLWSAFIVLVLLKVLTRLPDKTDKLITKVGESTYHIYLIQMIYYAAGLGNLVDNMIIRIIINILVCCIVGVLFKTGEEKVWNHIRNRNL